MSGEREPPIQIRLATSEDVSDIAAVLHNAFDEFESRYTAEGFAATVLTPDQIQVRLDEGPVWIALENQNVLGTVSAMAKGDALYIRGMAVDPSVRGKGIGHKLLECAEEFALQSGFKRLLLSTTPFLTRAIQLYEKHGFSRSSDGPTDLFGTPLFTMFKPLGVVEAEQKSEGGVMVDPVILKRFETPDELRQMSKGRFEIVRVGGVTIGRATYQPGWKWSLDVGPTIGATHCTVEHVGLVLAGTATAAFENGKVIELSPGCLFHIPSLPHDSWVVGSDVYVSLHFLGVDEYAK